MDAVGCDWLLTELGPPPDAILRIPPPPLPHFIDRVYLHEMAAAATGIGDNDRDNDTTLPCHWCHWARRLDSVGSISVTSGTEIALEDTWFFVILASCLMLTLGAFLSGIIYLRLNGKTLKGAWDFGSFLSENGSILIGSNSVGLSPTGGERHHNGSAMTPVRPGNQPENSKPDCQAACPSGNMGERFLHSCGSSGGSMVPAAQRHVTTPSSFSPLTRALWAGVKTSEGNHYTITHAQPFDQKRSSLHDFPSVAVVPSDPQHLDEDSAGYTTLHPSATTSVNAFNPCTNTDNKMYYCCTDLILIQQSPSSAAVQQVTSLDDSAEMTFEGSPNPLYVNMSPLHPLSSPKLNYPLVNPVYPSPCRPQQLRIVGNQTTSADIDMKNNQFTHHQINSALQFIPAHLTRQHLS